MKVLSTFAAMLFAGCPWASQPPNQEGLLYHIFGNVMKNRFKLGDLYFAMRPDWDPRDSTLYRFNLTKGILLNIGYLLQPTYKKDECRAEWKQDQLSAICHFNLKDAVVTYEGKMSFGKDVVEEFLLQALITEFPFGNHRNPASLGMFVYYKRGCNGYLCDIRECLITNFLLDATTVPSFWDFEYIRFRENRTLAEEVWRDFEVKVFTHVRLLVMRTINYTCRTELPKRNITSYLLTNES
uniref:Lipocalin n=1 Tax=Rhipicephalus zambeziensis TaxID=60191 RepID=A0A224YKY9_9ACAR